MRKITALRGFAVVFQLADLKLGCSCADAIHPESLRRKRYYVVVIQVNDLPGMRRDRIRIACEEMLALAHADNERRTPARAYHDIGKIGADHSNAVGAD